MFLFILFYKEEKPFFSWVLPKLPRDKIKLQENIKMETKRKHNFFAAKSKGITLT
jgi:hypothetical protein